MFIDASALVAMVARESEGADFARRIEQAPARYTSPLAAYEAVLAVARLRNSPVPETQVVLDRFITAASIEITSITPEIGRLAIDAFARFGRGNHPAWLDMGDCFAYACARSLDVPLLFKGGDFSQIDIGVA